MPRPDPLPKWPAADVFIIGGGPSLRGFDFDQLKGRHVIGVNQAVELGHPIVDIVFFGDTKFWTHYERQLHEFGGWVVTQLSPCQRRPDWLRCVPRVRAGLCKNGQSVAWNHNSGAAAINLALNLGARRVFLLGFDCGRTPKQHHWHDHAIEEPRMGVYEKFMQGFQTIAGALPNVYPGHEIINVTDGSSQLTVFPTMGFAHLGLRVPVGV